ncbi:TPA: NAD(P)/FAD-dependent oxidoreductase [Candidatus Bathyarchaeota archaeon]|nr:NAD(P)/FAD-dependent oxidoreductase [Candidatus Bathyarchaeota archaeon]
MKLYDVVVVGAGPAGSSAALKASELGLKTLLVDKKREVGVPVQCGEYMPHEDEVKRMFPNSKHTSRFIELTKACRRNECDVVRFVSPSGKMYDVKYRAYVIDREKFDKALVDEAKNNGCEVLLKTLASNVYINDNKLALIRNGRCEVVSFKVLIAADGFNSGVANSLGLKTTSWEDKATTIQRVMGNVSVERNVCEMYWDKDCSPGGYAWIIPKGESVANVGLGIRKKFSKGSLTNFLNHFISRHPVASKRLKDGTVSSTVGGVVPVGGPIPKTFHKNIIVVGDAAGQVAAHVGGGVPSSVICGEIAGETAYRHLKEGASIGEYEETWRKELGGILDRALKLRRIGDLFINNNRLIDLILGVLGERGLSKLIRCEMLNELEILLNSVSLRKKGSFEG